RKRRSWSQEELATAAGLNLRTIQRIETEGVASLQSLKALAAALDVEVPSLGAREDPMKTCPECQSSRVFRYNGTVDSQLLNGNLLPGFYHSSLRNMFKAPRMTPVVCADCGHLRLFVEAKELKHLEKAKNWLPA
ncbi:MAG: helix-turn-helix transcriptional regulator, partial [Bryobacterales bacterium]|nr:helix-turn-helix transcriptional regulator [Bryobacterales bacterium]